MKVLLDEGVPRQLLHSLRKHNVTTVPDAGWASIKNGVLLELIEQSDFGVFMTCDKNMEYQQSELTQSSFAVLVLSTNHWPSMEPHVDRVVEAVEQCKPGSVFKIECGRFIPRKFRTSSA